MESTISSCLTTLGALLGADFAAKNLYRGFWASGSEPSMGAKLLLPTAQETNCELDIKIPLVHSACKMSPFYGSWLPIHCFCQRDFTKSDYFE